MEKKYDPVGAKYNFVDFYAHEGDVITAVISFSPAPPGARNFIFIDDERDAEITITLTTPVQIYDYLVLKDYPYSFRYQLKYWKSGATEDGNGVLTHLSITNCQIIEMAPALPQGTLINTIAIGPITYNIFRYFEQNWSGREYLAVAGLDGIDPDAPPFLRVTIPYDNANACIFDVSEVLVHLQQPPAETP